ncbi:hypothetical protein TrST_g3876 [Triparma strigata]|uniref:Major facilitator superfamily (MFS) profile domain-containing protein n=1 Tax=Triparma strigata TaxID=1606541 RepID=A0A9W7BQF9_9STRA|nr:hypothetical protein TrST_g3876 [Triparma strigata]
MFGCSTRFSGIVCGGVISGLGFGINSSLGLFLKPISDDQGFGREVLSMAIALAVLLNGFTSIFWGALNDRYGVLLTCGSGATLVFASLFLASFASSSAAFMVTIPFQGAAGGAISFGVTLGAVARLFGDHELAQRSRALGLTTSLGSLGVVVVPPVAQALLHAYHWRPALRLVGLGTLVMLPMALVLARAGRARSNDDDVKGVEIDKGEEEEEEEEEEGNEPDLHRTLLAAQAHPPYILLVLGFFVCGFHVVFVSTHLPSYCEDEGLPSWVGATALSVIGIGNVIGTATSGALGAKFPGDKNKLLSALYFSRACLFALFCSIPLSEATVLGFAFVLGLLWLSTVPLTSGLLSDMFSPKYGSTLFGIAFCSHQLGSFFGAWLGGKTYDSTGSYDLMWWLMVIAGVLASVLHWPIRNERVKFLYTMGEINDNKL